jgi:putative hydrolase of HD superfamily
MKNQRLAEQVRFVIEIDKLKTVLRQNFLNDRSRRENTAEHSWHLALMAVVLAEYAPQPVDLLRVIKMLLIHDLVEIYAGDTFCYDVQGNLGKADREQSAADRIYGLLPGEQAAELMNLWHEFEANATPEAQFAIALDRFQPFLQNQQTNGGTWRIHNISAAQVLGRMAPIQTGAPALWPLVEAGITEGIAAGYLQP